MNTPFSPPLYMQRYQFVVDYVQTNRPRKVIDLGCAECCLLGKLKFHRDCIQLLVGVDINADSLLKRSKLYRVVYPSLCDNNIYQRTLVNEVLYEAQRLRQEWLQKNIDSNNNTHVHCYPSVEAEHRGAEGGADEQLSVYQQGGTICVPLSSVWSRPRVRGLCGTLHRLREILLDDSLMRLNADGTVLILPAVDDDDDEVEEEDKEEEVKTASDVAENVKENWDEELAAFGNV
ncbi:Small RNA 2'-O-methyltransferase [Triplophysa tibetana]|uniref:Small RNA 2'-O-methyltransferase n=1 Tax=Triplophysa tibetana TaxID=1572043 RepID=A0A5A9NFQ7_9TELE|nr:Small RNA 2'-O-methyltransferase [Triplophysa tibetana]